MRVMIVSPRYVPWVGGLEILLQQLAPELAARGHDLVIVTSHGREAESGLTEVDGTPVLRVPAHAAIAERDTAAIFAIQRDIARLSRDFSPELVHSHDVGPALWMYLRAARKGRPPIVVTLHNVMTQQFDGSMELLTRMLEEADWVTGVSQDVVDDTLRFAPSVAAHISVIRNGVALPTEEPDPPPIDPPRLACIGRLVEQKGFDRAIDAVAAVVARHPRLRLTIAGDGPQRRTLEQQAAARGVADRVEFVGILDRSGVERLLRESTAVLMPSRFEGLPLVALEAAGAGRPVVAARAPGLDEAVVDDVTAVVVEPDVPRLADAIERVLSDPGFVRRLGAAARAHAIRHFSLGACADAYDRLYRSFTRTEHEAAQ